MNADNLHAENSPGAEPVRAGEHAPRRAGLWVFIVVLVLFAAQVVWRWPRLPSDINSVVGELSSAEIIEKPPVVNDAGTLAAVAHTTKYGVGVFFVNTRTRDETKLAESKNSDYMASWLRLLGWSPDDHWFVFTMNPTLRFCDGTTGHQAAEFTLTHRVVSLAWLSPRRCAYVDESSQLHLLSLEHGTWVKSEVEPLPSTNGPTRSLAALDGHELVWQSNNDLWRMNLSSGQIHRIYSACPNLIAALSFSMASHAFLLTEETPTRPHVYILGRVALGGDGRAATFEQWSRGSSVLDAQWLNEGKGYAYRAVKGNHTVLVMKNDSFSSPVTWFSAGQVWTLFCDGASARAYAVASRSSEPAGLWRCNARNLAVPNYAFSPWGKRVVHFHFQPALTGNAPYGGRHWAKFEIVPPVHFSREKKYPLVIGPASYEWTPIAHGEYAQALAYCGAFVALVDYRWNQRRIQTIYHETNNVLAVYDQLTANPSVDKNRVYLFGYSAGTLVVKKLIENFPGRWRGIMLMNPSVLPKVSDDMTRQVLLTAGGAEDETQRLERYQEALCRVGIPSRWFIFKDEQHVVRGQAAFDNRTRLMVDMVFKK